MKETGLFIIKPDALLLGEDEVAREKIEGAGLEIANTASVTFTAKQIKDFYHDKQDGLSSYWEGYLGTMPSSVLVVKGENPCGKLGEIKRALREEYEHDGFYTGTHSSDSPSDAKREMEILLPSSAPGACLPDSQV